MGDIIQLRDWQNPRDLERLYGASTLELMAVELFNVALATYDIASDTAPSELNPDKEPA